MAIVAALSNPIGDTRPPGGAGGRPAFTPPNRASRFPSELPGAGQLSPQAQRLQRATAEFEGLLVSELWQDMVKGLDDLTEGDSAGLGAGFDALEGVGFEAMATSMASAGGLGLGRMIYHSLEPALSRGETGA
jgi:Rod binding domain-containing protein